jgi:hypothetical protein
MFFSGWEGMVWWVDFEGVLSKGVEDGKYGDSELRSE